MAGGMMQAARIECEKAEDRDALVVILARNGYSVRQVKEKPNPKGTRYAYFVEYWKWGVAREQ